VSVFLLIVVNRNGPSFEINNNIIVFKD